MTCKKKSSIEDFVKNHKIREKYMSELALCEKINIPINDCSAHWYLTVLIVKTQIVEIRDSLPSCSSNSHREEIVRAIGLNEVFLDDYFRKFNPLSDFCSFTISYPDNVPIQPNGTDCGFFVMKFMETQWDMLSIKYYNSTVERYRVALHLVNGDANKMRDSIRDKAELFHESHKNNLPPNKVTKKVDGQKNLKKKK